MDAIGIFGDIVDECADSAIGSADNEAEQHDPAKNENGGGECAGDAPTFEQGGNGITKDGEKSGEKESNAQ
jgi:hypothetical protein